MCGFYGEIAHGNNYIVIPNDTRLAQVESVLSDRGPDVSKTISFGGKGFIIHSRLAIIDDEEQSVGPILDRTEDHAFAYNGEIYNCLELKKKYAINARELSTGSDTELLSILFMRHGPEMLNELDGIFAFAHYSLLENRLLLCVDHLGVKPLYYRMMQDRIIFCSDFRLLIQGRLNESDLDPDGITSYLALRYVTGQKTIVKDIHKVTPGQYVELSGGSLKIRRYWTPQFVPEFGLGLQQWTDEIENAFLNSLNTQFIGRVPSSVLLSGGFDSSALLGGLCHLGKTVPSISCYFHSDKQVNLPDFNHEYSVVNHVTDESYFAAKVAARAGSPHQVIRIQSECGSVLFNKHVAAMGEPMASIDAFGNFCLASNIPPEVKVLYSGVGNDELYGGYTDIYFGIGGHMLRPGLSGLDYIRMLSDPGHQRLDLVDCLLPSYSYLGYAIDEFDSHLRNSPARNNAAELINETALMFMTSGDLPWWELKQADAMYMAFGLEVRVPYLSRALVDIACRIPSNLKYQAGREKVVLKKALSRFVPEDVCLRAKCPSLGFPIEVFTSDWFQRAMRNSLESPPFVFDRVLLKKMCNTVRGRSEHQYYDLMYRLVVLTVWLDLALEGNLICT